MNLFEKAVAKGEKADFKPWLPIHDVLYKPNTEKLRT